MLEFVSGWARRFFLKYSQTKCGYVGAVGTNIFKVFWPRDSTIFCNSPAVVLGECVATQIILCEFTSDIFYSYKFLGVPISVSNVYSRKTYVTYVFPPFSIVFCVFFVKRSKGLIMQIYFQSLLWSYLPSVLTILTTSVYTHTHTYTYTYIFPSRKLKKMYVLLGWIFPEENIYVWIYIYIYIYICVCVCVCVFVYTVYVYIYTVLG